MLAAGKGELLVSGDAEGYVQFLRVPPPPAPTPALPRSYHAVTGPPASKGPSAAGGTASAATAQNGRRASAATVGVGEAFAGSVVGGAVVGGGVTSGTGGGGSSNVEAPLLALSEGQSLLRDSDDSADSVDFIPQRRETMSAVGFSQELSPAVRRVRRRGSWGGVGFVVVWGSWWCGVRGGVGFVVVWSSRGGSMQWHSRGGCAGKGGGGVEGAAE
eukprot:84158-Chlamydomonas_euryale.AAC.1